MKNVIKSQLYQIRKDKLIWGVFLIIMFLEFTNMNGEMGYSDLNGAGLYVAGNGINIVLLCLMFLGVAVGQICGADFTDKTTNYEMMSGHTRKQVYFGRVIPAVIICMLASLVLTALPIIIAQAIYGWGDLVKLEDVIIRWLLLIFPMFRIACEMIFITFIAKNPYVTMIVGFVAYTGGIMLTEMFSGGEKYLLGVLGIKFLSSFESYSSYSIIDGHVLTSVYSTLDFSEAYSVMIGSVVFGIAFLLIGYYYFKKDDMN